MNILVPSIRKEFVAVAQFTPHERIQERIAQLIVDIPVPPTLEEMAEVLPITPHEGGQERIAKQSADTPSASRQGGTRVGASALAPEAHPKRVAEQKIHLFLFFMEEVVEVIQHLPQKKHTRVIREAGLGILGFSDQVGNREWDSAPVSEASARASCEGVGGSPCSFDQRDTFFFWQSSAFPPPPLCDGALCKFSRRLMVIHPSPLRRAFVCRFHAWDF